MDRRGLLATLMSVLLLSSVLVNVLQARRLKALAVEYSDSVENGTILPPLQVKDLSGRDVQIQYKGTRQATVVYIFQPSCPYCRENLNDLQALVRQAGPRYRFIAISLTDQDLMDYLKEYSLAINERYDDPSQSTVAAYKMNSTPTTLVVSSKGKLIGSWIGAYVGQNKSGIERFFSVHLP